MDMVKPIPANIPAPVICFIEMPVGKLPRLNLISKKQNKTMPIGLPINRPMIIPRLLFVVKSFTQPSESIKQVLAKAKMGRIIKATGL